MPIKKHPIRKRPAIRRRRWKRRSTRPTTAISYSLGFPDRMFLKLKYSDLHLHSYTGTGAVAWLQYRANSIFDPYFTGVGHQPMCHDEWATFYNRYRVYGMKYIVTLNNTSTAEQVEAYVQHRPNSTLTTAPNDVRENAETRKFLTLGVEGSGKNIKTCKGYVDVSKVRGITRGRLKYESDYQALFGNNPPIECFLNVGILNQNTGTSSSPFIRVDLVYYVEVFDRKKQTGS